MDREDTLLMRTMKGATMGLVGGTIYGLVTASWYDESNRVLPRLLKNLKLVITTGLTFATIGGVYYGVERLMQYPKESFMFNGAT